VFIIRLSYHSRSCPPTPKMMATVPKSDSCVTGTPEQPTAPVPVRVNHHSIELTWGWADSGSRDHRPCYTLQIEDCSKGGTGGDGGYVTVYR
jgi:hypothetical protein